MELPSIGQRCAFSECKQLDFLPFTCSHCQLIYCRDHYTPDCHSCSSNSPEKIAATVPVKTYKCSFLLCKTQNPVEMGCPVCSKHFCLEHRHHGCIDLPQEIRDKEREKWETPKKLFEVAKLEAEKQISVNLSRAKTRPKINKTAIKVQLMRLKGKAVGLKSIPTGDRTYFLIIMPLNLKRSGKAIFVERNWTIGRVIDAASDLCDVSNKNNESSSKKLRLFRFSDGSLLSEQMDTKLDDLLKGQLIVDGESLVLEYVDNIVMSGSQIDPQLYKDI